MPRKARDDSMVDTEELEDLWAEANAMIDRLGKVPPKVATSAAGPAATAVKRNIKARAPKKSGDLKKGIIRKGEKSRYKGKKVYEITFDSSMNSVFQKKIKEPGKLGSSKTGQGYAYYPVSQDSGYLARGKNGDIVYRPGLHFMREGAESSQLVAQETMVKKLNEKLQQEWLKQSGN